MQKEYEKGSETQLLEDFDHSKKIDLIKRNKNAG